MYVDFLHHLCTGLYRIVVHNIIITFKILIRVSNDDAILSIDSVVLGDYRMLLCSDVLCI